MNNVNNIKYLEYNQTKRLTEWWQKEKGWIGEEKKGTKGWRRFELYENDHVELFANLHNYLGFYWKYFHTLRNVNKLKSIQLKFCPFSMSCPFAHSFYSPLSTYRPSSCLISFFLSLSLFVCLWRSPFRRPNPPCLPLTHKHTLISSISTIEFLFDDKRWWLHKYP